jgi:hypothetical protein
LGGSSAFQDALRALRDALDRVGAPWMCIGGVAVTAHGVSRATVDIDATVLAASVDPERIVAAAAPFGIVPRIDDSVSFAQRNQVLLLRHAPSSVPLDVSMAWLPFEEEAIRASLEVDYAGVAIRVPRPEDLVIYKVVASRPRDVDDAEKLLLLHGPAVDVVRARRIVAQFCDALEDRTRERTLADLLRRAGLG